MTVVAYDLSVSSNILWSTTVRKEHVCLNRYSLRYKKNQQKSQTKIDVFAVFTKHVVNLIQDQYTKNENGGIENAIPPGAEDLIQSVDLQDNMQMQNQLQLKIGLLQDLSQTIRDGKSIAQMRSEHRNKRVKSIHKINSHLPLFDLNFVSPSPYLGKK